MSVVNIFKSNMLENWIHVDELTEHKYANDDCKEHQEDAEGWGERQRRMISVHQASCNPTRQAKQLHTCCELRIILKYNFNFTLYMQNDAV